ncbi:MAG: glucose-1-phosphate thymidylyltransferase RfbA [Actinomycetes bacterium]|jgi:glucose-1-phosphate thymidylyltransferase|nr:glucose-1-phosphate thymidylyltransferase RfbA [Actinomycetes bacterium]
MKGIILAGGRGTRLYPITKGISKHLLPIYDKPMIYYPLSVLMLAGIRDVLIISTPRDLGSYRDLLGDGTQLGMRFDYAEQSEPKGLADAFIVGADFIEDEDVCLILGDNIFYGQNLTLTLEKAQVLLAEQGGAVIFSYPVKDPRQFGVVEFNERGEVLSIEEKPEHPRSKFAIPGLYLYDNTVLEKARNIKPSARGEIEISAINNAYLAETRLRTLTLGRGIAWLDTGSCAGLIEAAEFVKAVQSRQGFYVSCIEEIAWRRGFIDDNALYSIGQALDMTEYGQYLISLVGAKD